MSYVTQQELIDRFGQTELAQLTDRTNGTTIDATVIATAIDDADAKINSYISVTHALPLSPVPANLKRIAGDIARFFLYDDRVNDQVQKRYDEAIAWLKDVAAGRASLGVDAAGAAPSPADTVQFPTSQKVFAREEIDSEDC